MKSAVSMSSYNNSPIYFPFQKPNFRVMQNQGLVFIPDISGFTEFVNQIEIDHGRLIIKELLEIIIDANEAGLEISEIEGDAILFYRFGQQPTMQEIYRQVEKMFCAFHQSLKEYENRRYCQCKACLSAGKLTLKVVSHYGEFTTYDVRNFKKLIGRDVIVAHRLLKNDIDSHEYWLVTDSLYSEKDAGALPSWLEWTDSSKAIESGHVKFYYAALSPLKNQLSPVPLYRPKLNAGDRVISVSHDYRINMITMFHAVGDAAVRHRWVPGVKRVEVTNHFLPRVGMRWKIVTDEGEYAAHASGYYYQDEKIDFTESDETTGNITYYIIEKRSDSLTRVTIELFVPNRIKRLKFQLLQKASQKRRLEEALKRLEAFSRSLEQEEAAATPVPESQ